MDREGSINGSSIGPWLLLFLVVVALVIAISLTGPLEADAERFGQVCPFKAKEKK